MFSQTAFRSSAIDGTASAPGLAAAVQLSRHFSVHAEYTAPNQVFHPAAGSIPDVIVQNLVPATSRVAGLSQGIESRRVSYTLSEMVGVHPSPWGRLRIELLGGLSVQGQENRDYYEAYGTTGQGRTDRIPGKYYVLDFETPEFAVVFGLDAEVAGARRFVVVPMIRYHGMGDPGPSIGYGVGAHWRF